VLARRQSALSPLVAAGHGRADTGVRALPGRIPDTKLDLTANPLRFLARATTCGIAICRSARRRIRPTATCFRTARSFWPATCWVCRLDNPAGVVGAAAHGGFLGLLRVAETLGIGSPTSRMVGAVAFALSPRVLSTIDRSRRNPADDAAPGCCCPRFSPCAEYPAGRFERSPRRPAWPSR